MAPVLPGYITIPTGEYEVSVLHLLLALIPDLYKELVTSVSPVFSPTFHLVLPSFKALSLYHTDTIYHNNTKAAIIDKVEVDVFCVVICDMFI